jgi:hypothetical protein
MILQPVGRGIVGADQQAIPTSAKKILCSSADSRRRCMADIRGEESHGIRSLRSQRTGGIVGAVIQLVGGSQDAILCVLRDRPPRGGIIQDCRNGARRKSYMLSDGVRRVIVSFDCWAVLFFVGICILRSGWPSTSSAVSAE